MARLAQVKKQRLRKEQTGPSRLEIRNNILTSSGSTHGEMFVKSHGVETSASHSHSAAGSESCRVCSILKYAGGFRVRVLRCRRGLGSRVRFSRLVYYWAGVGR